MFLVAVCINNTKEQIYNEIYEKVLEYFINDYEKQIEINNGYKLCAMATDKKDNDIDVVYSYIKNDYKRFFKNPLDVLYEIKNKVSNDTFDEIIKLYDKYKTKII